MATGVAEVESGCQAADSRGATDSRATELAEAPGTRHDGCDGARLPASSLESAEYELLYRPTMVGVYTARHQRMPESDRALREHVFGSGGQPGCEVCREETEFLVAHQMRFF